MKEKYFAPTAIKEKTKIQGHRFFITFFDLSKSTLYKSAPF